MFKKIFLSLAVAGALSMTPFAIGALSTSQASPCVCCGDACVCVDTCVCDEMGCDCDDGNCDCSALCCAICCGDEK